jgi:hypothetical protein
MKTGESDLTALDRKVCRARGDHSRILGVEGTAGQVAGMNFSVADGFKRGGPTQEVPPVLATWQLHEIDNSQDAYEPPLSSANNAWTRESTGGNAALSRYGNC